MQMSGFFKKKSISYTRKKNFTDSRVRMSPLCVLFDADGVVIQGEYFSTIYAREVGIDPSQMDIFFHTAFPACAKGEKDLKEALLPFLSERKWTKSVEEFIHFWHAAEHTVEQEMITYIQSLRQKNIRCSLATNQEKYRTQYLKESMWFANIFDDIFASSDIGHRKPEQEFFTHISSYLEAYYKIPKHRTLFFDDQYKNIRSANSCGIQWYLYQWLDHMKKTIDDFTI
jgi:putative hydrolase of the HAD superfamily